MLKNREIFVFLDFFMYLCSRIIKNKVMTQEDKQLLFQDLCGRLSCGVKVLNTAEGVNEICELDSIMTSRKYKDKIFVSLTLPDDSIMVGIEMVKPYLRPLSSMTEEEDKEYTNIDNRSYSCPKDYAHIPAQERIDWFNAHHFDYRGLIPKGLALKAPEGMYK